MMIILSRGRLVNKMRCVHDKHCQGQADAKQHIDLDRELQVVGLLGGGHLSLHRALLRLSAAHDIAGPLSVLDKHVQSIVSGIAQDIAIFLVFYLRGHQEASVQADDGDVEVQGFRRARTHQEPKEVQRLLQPSDEGRHVLLPSPLQMFQWHRGVHEIQSNVTVSHHRPGHQELDPQDDAQAETDVAHEDEILEALEREAQSIALLRHIATEGLGVHEHTDTEVEHHEWDAVQHDRDVCRIEGEDQLKESRTDDEEHICNCPDHDSQVSSFENLPDESRLHANVDHDDLKVKQRLGKERARQVVQQDARVECIVHPDDRITVDAEGGVFHQTKACDGVCERRKDERGRKHAVRRQCEAVGQHPRWEVGAGPSGSAEVINLLEGPELRDRDG
mmetsp:Transcript_106125/g.269502  ORF Transcript_106125/g.269502 Transcript_106125/m.269502 type:complete len:391 (-) Transcript_106125:772-1944(-)